MVVDPEVPLLAVVQVPAGLGLWQGAQPVLPTARVAHVAPASGTDGRAWALDRLPSSLEERLGVLVFCAEVADGGHQLALLERLEALGVAGERLRLITAVAAAPGLRRLADRFPGLAIHCACIDAELDAQGRTLPGIGDPQVRLFAGTTPA
jgi:uracil phosphoribosyltransferase